MSFPGEGISGPMSLLGVNYPWYQFLPRGRVPPPTRVEALRRSVRILLECFLVHFCTLSQFFLFPEVQTILANFERKSEWSKNIKFTEVSELPVDPFEKQTLSQLYWKTNFVIFFYRQQKFKRITHFTLKLCISFQGINQQVKKSKEVGHTSYIDGSPLMSSNSPKI